MDSLDGSPRSTSQYRFLAGHVRVFALRTVSCTGAQVPGWQSSVSVLVTQPENSTKVCCANSAVASCRSNFHRHFHWAAENGIDGFFLQRFVGQCDMAPERDNEGIRRLRDEVGDVVRDAAEKEGRVFAIMFDLCFSPVGFVFMPESGTILPV